MPEKQSTQLLENIKKLVTMKSGHRELLKLQTNAGEEQSKEVSLESSELIEREQVDGSPFWIIGNKVDGYFLAFGKYRLTEPKESIEVVRQDLKVNLLNIIGSYVLTLMELRDMAIADAENNI